MDAAKTIIAQNATALSRSFHPVTPGKRRVAYYLRRLAEVFTSMATHIDGDPDWPMGLVCLGAVRAIERGQGTGDEKPVRAYFARLFDSEGIWNHPLTNAAQVLPAYSLLIFQRLRPEKKFEAAIRHAACTLKEHYVRESDGSIRYVPYRRELLVDTLGMICPFLMGYGVQFDDADARELANLQLRNFARSNLDPETGLPFHAYYAGGPYRLGPCGWGRGTGWFLMGLVDTWIEGGGAPDEVTGSRLDALLDSLDRFQRSDGHWSWLINMPDTPADSSTTAFCGYALARARRAGLLGSEVDGMLARARDGILNATDSSGWVSQSSGECYAIGNYSMSFTKNLWAQGMATAFLAEVQDIQL